MDDRTEPHESDESPRYALRALGGWRGDIRDRPPVWRRRRRPEHLRIPLKLITKPRHLRIEEEGH